MQQTLMISWFDFVELFPQTMRSYHRSTFNGFQWGYKPDLFRVAMPNRDVLLHDE